MKRAARKAVKAKAIGPDPEFWAHDFIVYEPTQPDKRPIPKPIKLKPGKKTSLDYIREQRD